MSHEICIKLADLHAACKRPIIERSKRCYCYCCLGSFERGSIKKWLSDDYAICPYCGVDSVIGDATTAFQITPMLMYVLKQRWFENEASPRLKVINLYPKEVTMEAYCVRCKAKREMKDTEEVTMKNGCKAMKGKCSVCGTGMYKILGKAAT